MYVHDNSHYEEIKVFWICSQVEDEDEQEHRLTTLFLCLLQHLFVVTSACSFCAAKDSESERLNLSSCITPYPLLHPRSRSAALTASGPRAGDRGHDHRHDHAVVHTSTKLLVL